MDALTRLATEVLAAPIALVSLVDAHRQWFKSRSGLASTETPREDAFCAHAIAGDGQFEIGDACSVPRFHDNPLVTVDPRAAAVPRPRGAAVRRRGATAGDRIVVRNGVPVHDAAGCFVGYRGVSRDATEAMAARREGGVAESRLREAIEAINEGFLMTDAQGRIVLTNP